ncbi:MAG: membrane protein [Sulfurovum sp. FS08-3]|nr:MAG: membrane protein [Sulfurovum sp. FS08-3]
MEIFYILLFLIGAIVYTMYKGVNIVPQGEEWVIERLGKFNRTITPGLNIITPFLDTIKVKIDTRDIILDVEKQEVITLDNVVIITNAVAFIRVTNPRDAIYGVEDYKQAISQLVKTTLRSIIGEMNLDDALSSREQIKSKLKSQILDDVADWGITVKSIEIQDINPSESMQASMERQAAAERERRAVETQAEGLKNAAILEAQGKLEAAKREAEAQVALATASSEAIKRLGEAMQGGELPAMFLLGDRYIDAMEHLSKSPNSKLVIYPADLQAAVKGMIGGLLHNNRQF